MRGCLTSRTLLAAAITIAAPASTAQILSEWLNPVDGNWSDPSNWSTPAVPHNTGGSAYDAFIAAGGVSDYTVSINSGDTFTVDSLTLDDPHATLFLELADLTAGIIDVRAGVLQTRGDLFQAQVIATGAGGPIQWESVFGGRTDLYAFRLSTDVDFFGEINSTLNIHTSLELDDGVVMTSDVDTLIFRNAGNLLTTTGQATLRLLDFMSVVGAEAGPLLVDSGITIEIAHSRAGITGAFDNHGVIRVTGAGIEGEIGSNPNDPVNISNYNLIESINGAVLSVYRVMQHGILRATDTAVIQLSDMHWRPGGQIEGDGTFYVTGLLELNGNTINIDPAGAFIHAGGMIRNGTVQGSPGTVLEIDASSPGGVDLEALTLDVDVSVDSRTHSIIGGLTLLNGAVITSTSPSGTVRFRFEDAQTITGQGTIRFGDQGDFGGILSMAQPSGAVIFDTGIFIDALHGSGVIGSEDKQWVNRGTIAVGTSRALRLDGDWSNEGTFILENSSELRLEGNVQTSALGTVLNQGGRIVIDGTLDNTGDVLDLLFLPGEFVLGDGTLRGGTVQSTGNTTLIFTDHVRLDRVTFDLTPTPARAVSFTEFIEINDIFVMEAVASSERGAGLYPVDGDGDGLSHLRGAGTIVFAGKPGSSTQGDIDFGADYVSNLSGLVIDPGLTVLLDDPGVNVEFKGRSDFINRGTIDLRAGSATFDNKWTNEGVIRTSGTADVTLAGLYTTADLLSIDYQGGTVTLTDDLDNTGAVLRKDAASFWGESILPWHSALDITGGRIETGDGMSLTNIKLLDGVIVAGDVWLSSFETTKIENGITLDGGTLHVIGRDTELASGDLSGTGAVQLDSNGFAGLYGLVFDHPLTVAPGVEVRTGTVGGSIGSTGTDWINNGTLRSLNAGLELRIDGSLTNAGSAHAANGGSISFENLVNTGQLLAEDGGLIVLDSGWANPTGTIILEDGGVLVVDAWPATPGAITLDKGVVRLLFDTDVAGLFLMPRRPGSFLEAAGDVDLAGGTLDLDALESSLNLMHGTLHDGIVVGTNNLRVRNQDTLRASALENVDIQTGLDVGDVGSVLLRSVAVRNGLIQGDAMIAVAQGGEVLLDGVGLGSPVTLDSDAVLWVGNGLAFDGTIASGNGSGASPIIVFNGDHHVAGTGAFEVRTTAGLGIVFTGDLTLGEGIAARALGGSLTFDGVGQTLSLNGTLEVAQLRTATVNADAFSNSGTVTLDAGSKLILNAVTMTHRGSIDLQSGQILATGRDLQAAVGSNLAGPGGIVLGGTGTLYMAGNMLLKRQASERLILDGDLELADTAHVFAVFDDTQTTSGVFLEVFGDAIIDGVLTLDSASDPRIQAGDTRLLVAASGLAGTFSRVNGMRAGPNLYWHLDYQDGQLVAEARLAGDTTGDGLVGQEDLALILDNLGNPTIAANTDLGDWSGDGWVGIADLDVVLANWGNTVDPENLFADQQPSSALVTAIIPEPSTLPLLSLTLLSLLHRQRRVSFSYKASIFKTRP